MKRLASKAMLRLAVGACVLLLAAGCGARRAEQHRKTGDTFLRLNDYPQASQAYERALELDPKNTHARFGQGVVLLRQQKGDEALAAFQKVIETDPSFQPAYLEAARLLLASQKVPEAEALAKKLQAANPESGDLMLAGIYLESGRAAEAVTFLQERTAGAQASVPLRIALAKAYQAAGQPDKAEAELKPLVESGDDSALPARMALIDLYRTQGKLAAMIDELRTLVEARPEDDNLKLVLARSLLESGDYAEAQKIAEPVLNAAPDSPWANYVIGSCFVAQGAYADAVPYLETAARALPQQPAVERQLALARSGGKAAPQAVPEAPLTAQAPVVSPQETPAEATFDELWKSAQLATLLENRERFLAERPDDMERRETLVLAALVDGRSPVAGELAQGLPADSPMRRFQEALAKQNYRAGMEAIQPLKDATGERGVLYRNALGLLLSRAGLRGQALVNLASVTRTTPDNVVNLMGLARMYRAAQMPEFSAGALQKLLSRYPENIEARTLLFQVYMESGRTDDAKAVAENLYGLFPDNREAVLSLAQVYALTGQTSLAADALMRSIEKHGEDPTYVLGLASVRLVEGNVADAVALAEKVQPASAMQDRMRRQVLAFGKASQGDWAGVSATLEGADDEIITVAVRLVRAAAQVPQGQVQQASEMLIPPGRIMPSEPKFEVLLQALGRPVEGLSDKQKALAAALAAKPTALTQYIYGLACIEAGLAEAAYAAFDKAALEVGEHPYLVMGRMAALAKLPESSERVSRARALAERNPDQPETWAALAALLQGAGDAPGAREALDKGLALAPDEPVVWAQQALFAEWQKDSDLALRSYERLVALVPDNPAYRNNHAYYLLQTDGSAAEALKEAQFAQEKIPGNPNVLHTLGLAQLRTGDTQKAHDTLRDAVERRPGDPTLLLDFGQALVDLNQPEEGRRHAAMALQCAELLQLDFPRRAEAELLAPSAAPPAAEPATSAVPPVEEPAPLAAPPVAEPAPSPAPPAT